MAAAPSDDDDDDFFETSEEGAFYAPEFYIQTDSLDDETTLIRANLPTLEDLLSGDNYNNERLPTLAQALGDANLLDALLSGNEGTLKSLFGETSVLDHDGGESTTFSDHGFNGSEVSWLTDSDNEYETASETDLSIPHPSVVDPETSGDNNEAVMANNANQNWQYAADVVDDVIDLDVLQSYQMYGWNHNSDDEEGSEYSITDYGYARISSETSGDDILEEEYESDDSELLDPPLVTAAYNGDVIEVASLLQQGEDPNIRAHNGVTPLHAAVLDNHANIATLLLQHFAYVDIRLPICGWTPLHKAAARGAVECCEVLTQFGADPLARKNDDVTCIQLATQNGRVELADKLFRVAQNGSPPVRHMTSLQHLSALAVLRKLKQDEVIDDTGVIYGNILEVTSYEAWLDSIETYMLMARMFPRFIRKIR